MLLSQGEANQELKRGKWSIGRRLKIGRKEEMMEGEKGKGAKKEKNQMKLLVKIL